MNPPTYSERIAELEAEGLNTSDAQAVIDLADARERARKSEREHLRALGSACWEDAPAKPTVMRADPAAFANVEPPAVSATLDR